MLPDAGAKRQTLPKPTLEAARYFDPPILGNTLLSTLTWLGSATYIDATYVDWSFHLE